MPMGAYICIRIVILFVYGEEYLRLVVGVGESDLQELSSRLTTDLSTLGAAHGGGQELSKALR